MSNKDEQIKARKIPAFPSASPSIDSILYVDF